MKRIISVVTLIAFGFVGGIATCVPPVITTQPQSQTNVVGSTLSLLVEVTGTTPLSHQWRKGGGAVARETNATLIFTNLQSSHAGNYTVVITNADGAVTSAVAFLRVLVTPSISIQPNDQTVLVGSTATFSVTAAGTPPFAYQWEINGASLPGKTNSTLALTGLRFSNAGFYGVVVTNIAGSVTSRRARLTVINSFTKITTGGIGMDAEGSGSAGWTDYDGDGFIDLFVANIGIGGDGPARNALYRNNGNGTFTRVNAAPFTNDFGDFTAVGWADYDNDGHPDLFVGRYSTDGMGKNLLYHNSGDGTFTNMTNNAIAQSSGATIAAAWADYDNDGHLDLFVPTTMMLTNFLFHNNGDTSFTRITTGDVTMDGGGQGAAWADYDNDGDLDLFLSNNAGEFLPVPFSNNLFYQNNGNGSLIRQSLINITTDPGFAHGCAWGDYDNDGWLDLFVPQNSLARPFRSLLYHNNADGTFTRITNGPAVTDTADSIAATWGDFDNDGFLDLFVSNRQNAQSNFLYHNNGDGTFDKITTGVVVTDGGFSFDCVWGDYDNDGFLDLFVANGGDIQPQASFLYRNNGNSNAWITLRLIGTVSNRSAIGAKLRLKTMMGGRVMWQLREISGGENFGSQDDPRAHFGLGNATNVDLLRIEWPSGTVQEFRDLAVNQILSITEPPRLAAGGRKADGSFQFRLTGCMGSRYTLQVSSNLMSWTPWLTVTNTARTISIIDSDATAAPHRFYRVGMD